MARGNRELLEPDRAHLAPGVLRDYVAPYALDAVYQHVVRFSGFKRTTQAMDDYLAKLDLLRRMAGKRMLHGGASPKAFFAVLSLRNASLSRADKSVVVGQNAWEFRDRGDCALTAPVAWSNGRCVDGEIFRTWEVVTRKRIPHRRRTI